MSVSKVILTWFFAPLHITNENILSLKMFLSVLKTSKQKPDGKVKPLAFL